MSTDAAPLRITYLQPMDVLRVEGINYAGAFFRNLAQLPVGAVFRVCQRSNGVLTVHVLGQDDVVAHDG